MSALRIKKGDSVKVIAGKFKGRVGKVVATSPENRTVFVEGINVVKRHIKPNQLNPQGGIVDTHKGLDISKVAISHPSKKDTSSRVGFTVNKNVKKRIYKSNSKEIDS